MLRRITRLSPYTTRYIRSFTTISKSDNITHCVFDGGYINIAKSVLVNKFTATDEPLCYHLSRRNFDFFVEPYIQRAIQEKTSVVAKVNGVFAGICLNNDFTFRESEKFLEEIKKRDYFGFDMIWAMERTLNHDFRHEMRDKGKFKQGYILRMLMLGVDAHFAHQGFATSLTAESVKRAHELGYKYVTAACTNDHMKVYTLKTYILLHITYIYMYIARDRKEWI